MPTLVGLNVQAERKRLNCVLRVWKMRRVGLKAQQVNLAVETQHTFFTESLILAQNERWRRV